MNKLSIIIVSYNCREYLFNCLNSIVGTIGDIDYEVIIIDNGSKDDSVGMVKTLFPNVELILNNSNYGFARASNMGIHRASGDVLLFLNPDTKILDSSIKLMLNFVMTGKAFIVGPRLFADDQLSSHPSGGKFATISNVLLDFCPFVPRIKSTLGDFFKNMNQIRKVDWVSGAVFMVKRNVVEALNGFDESFFMYSEEADFCFRAKKMGYGTYYYPKAEVIHFGGKSTHEKRDKVDLIFWQSKIYFIKKHNLPKQFNKFKVLLLFLLRIKIILNRNRKTFYENLVKTLLEL